MERWKPGVTALVAAGLVCVTAVVPAAAQQPPQNLHKVGDHWTAWDPPTEHPPGAEVHIIEPGDTLWALAGRFYGDPYLWPQLWERNQYILDAHWIYPGDPLVVSMEVTPVEELGDVDLGGEEVVAEDDGLRLGVNTSPPQPLGFEDDIYCSGYIGELDEEFPYGIIGSEYQAMSPTLEGTGSAEGLGIYGSETVKVELTVGDIIYLDGGLAGGLSPGQVFTIVQRGEEIEHPLTDDTIGRMYAYRGRVRVLSVQEETAIAEIVQACDQIRVGDLLQPFVPEPVPLGRRGAMRPANDPTTAAALEAAPVIVHAKDDIITLGEDHVVFLDQGEAAGLAPGDVYTIYRRNRPGFPPVVIGELAILSVHPRSAVAKIIESRYVVYVGDQLERKL